MPLFGPLTHRGLTGLKLSTRITMLPLCVFCLSTTADVPLICLIQTGSVTSLEYDWDLLAILDLHFVGWILVREDWWDKYTDDVPQPIKKGTHMFVLINKVILI